MTAILTLSVAAVKQITTGEVLMVGANFLLAPPLTLLSQQRSWKPRTTCNNIKSLLKAMPLGVLHKWISAAHLQVLSLTAAGHNICYILNLLLIL